LYNFAMGSVIKQPFHIEEGDHSLLHSDYVNCQQIKCI